MKFFKLHGAQGKLLLAIATLLGLGVFCSPSLTGNAAAADFKAGRIIDDSIFYDEDTMSVSTIQTFLNSKLSTCDTNGTKSKSYYYNSGNGRVNDSRDTWVTTSRATYGQRLFNWNGTESRAPYTCLKSYSQVVPTVAGGGSELCKGSISGGTKSSSQIIYDVARACDINPKVLIVLLQKEQSLVTDDWPWKTQYQKATGYACPDTAPCDSEYFGFFNQVYNAAKAFQRYTANPANYSYRAGRNNTILWNPNTACGSSTVFIENQATANLYIYTPYRPNKAALEAGWGTGDSCSSYGNRNFFRYFESWFGSTLGGTSYAWGVQSQKAYTDNTGTTEYSNHTANLKFGQRAYMVLKIVNNGNTIWLKNSVRLATDKERNRQSSFCDPAWISCTRLASMNEDSVSPGEVGTFEFWVTAPRAPGNYIEYLNPVIENVGWFPRIGLYYPINVTPPDFDGTVDEYRVYTDSTRKTVVRESELKNGSRYLVSYKIKNTGVQTWQKGGPNPVRLGTKDNQNGTYCDPSWLTCNRPAAMKEDSVARGQVGTFEFWITTPYALDGYKPTTSYRLLREGINWFEYPRLNAYYNQKTPATTWLLEQQTSYTDATKSTLRPTNNINRGERVYAVIKARNLSGKTWSNSGGNPLRVATLNNRNGQTCDVSWITCTRPTTMKESTVAPGEVGTFEFWIKAPANKSINAAEYFTLVSEGYYWLGNLGLYYHVHSN